MPHRHHTIAQNYQNCFHLPGFLSTYRPFRQLSSARIICLGRVRLYNINKWYGVCIEASAFCFFSCVGGREFRGENMENGAYSERLGRAITGKDHQGPYNMYYIWVYYYVTAKKVSYTLCLVILFLRYEFSVISTYVVSLEDFVYTFLHCSRPSRYLKIPAALARSSHHDAI